MTSIPFWKYNYIWGSDVSGREPPLFCSSVFSSLSFLTLKKENNGMLPFQFWHIFNVYTAGLYTHSPYLWFLWPVQILPRSFRVPLDGLLSVCHHNSFLRQAAYSRTCPSEGRLAGKMPSFSGKKSTLSNPWQTVGGRGCSQTDTSRILPAKNEWHVNKASLSGSGQGPKPSQDGP